MNLTSLPALMAVHSSDPKVRRLKAVRMWFTHGHSHLVCLPRHAIVIIKPLRADPTPCPYPTPPHPSFCSLMLAGPPPLPICTLCGEAGVCSL